MIFHSFVIYFLIDTDTSNPLIYRLPEAIVNEVTVDFDVDGRDKVIEHVRQIYGEKNVCQISTFGSLKAKAAVRGVARVLDFPYSEADKIAKEEGLDLIEISPNANPPVCKIIDQGKYKYEHQKKTNKAKKKTTGNEFKRD